MAVDPRNPSGASVERILALEASMPQPDGRMLGPDQTWNGPDPDDEAISRDGAGPEQEHPPTGVQALTPEERALFVGGGSLFDAPPVRWAVPGLVALEMITQLAGKPKTGKTQLALGVVRSLYTREPFLGSTVALDRVLYLSEQGLSTFADQLARAGLRRGVLDQDADLFRRVRLMDMLPLSWLQRVDRVSRLIRTECMGRRVLVVVDTLGKWANLRPTEENDAGAMGAAMLPLQELAQEHGPAILVLVHAGKDDSRGTSDAARGSNAVAGDADILLHLKRPLGRPAHSRRVRELAGEGRPGGVLEDARLEWLDDGSWQLLDPDESSELARVELRVLAVLAASPDALTVDELVQRTEGVRSTLQRALDALMSTRRMLVEQLGDGRRGDPHRYRLRGSTIAAQ